MIWICISIYIYVYTVYIYIYSLHSITLMMQQWIQQYPGFQKKKNSLSDPFITPTAGYPQGSYSNGTFMILWLCIPDIRWTFSE